MKEPQRVVEAARKLVERNPTHARSWLVLARVLEGDDLLDERLAALSKAAELNPLGTEPHVQRSKLLAQAGRFDEAIAACRPKTFGATCRRRSSCKRRASSTSREIARRPRNSCAGALAENPDYWAGWSQLAQWFEEDESRAKDYLEAAERMIDLAPSDAWSWRHAGDAHRINKDENGALQAYERTLTLDPAYEYCTQWLVDYALDAQQLDKAEEYLASAMAHQPSAFVVARYVKWLGLRGRRSDAIAAFRNMLELPQPNEWPIRTGVEALTKLGAEGDSTELLRNATLQPGGETATRRFVEACAAANSWDACEKHLDKAPLENRAAGLRQMLTASVDHGKTDVAVGLTKRRREELRADVLLWATAGYAFCVLPGCRAKAVEWMNDWRTREGVEPWMLHNLANAYEALDRMREAGDVRSYALEMSAKDDRTADHRVYLAVHNLVNGDDAAASQLIDGVETRWLDRDAATVLTMAQTAGLLLQPAEPSGFAGWTLIRRFHEALKPHAEAIKDDPVLQRFRKRVLVQLLKKRGHNVSAWIMERM
ncbi:MAG: hypothetical protein QM775_02140 [Pirellulales bacterium]